MLGRLGLTPGAGWFGGGADIAPVRGKHEVLGVTSAPGLAFLGSVRCRPAVRPVLLRPGLDRRTWPCLKGASESPPRRARLPCRSEQRRVGTECVSAVRSRWEPSE